MMLVFFLMIRRPPRSTLDRSSAASDVYKRQAVGRANGTLSRVEQVKKFKIVANAWDAGGDELTPVSYTHLRAHETVLDLVCRLLLEKKKHHTHHLRTKLQYMCKREAAYNKESVPTSQTVVIM